MIQRPTRLKVYAKVSRNIMHALIQVCPDIEVFSVDETFIDITSCQTLYGAPEQAARKLKQAVYRASGLLCSLGLSGDKTTAKYAAKLNKPDGFTVIEPWQAKTFWIGLRTSTGWLSSKSRLAELAMISKKFIN